VTTQIAERPGTAPAIDPDRTSTRTLVLVGDLHLTDSASPVTHRLARLADTLTARALRGHGLVSLVLMGDSVDLVQVADGSRDPLGGRLAHGDHVACAKLDRIAAVHGELFAALGRLALAGGSVELVTGNHDQELARPVVQEHVRDLSFAAAADAPAPARARIGFHPFAFHVPGLLYAEHGHRYHAVNAAPPALRAHLDGADEPVRHPLGSLLTALACAAPSLDARARVRVRARLAPALLRGLGTTLLARQRPPARAIRGDRRLLARVAESTRLPEPAVAAIDRLAPPEAGIRRLLRLASPGAPNMLRAAGRVHAALVAADAATPLYCFGHTHVAEHQTLDGAASAEYLNAGAFGLPRDAARCHCSIVVRQRSEGAPLARLCDLGDGPDTPIP
jgi:UDP-2,3-diacylglucosamine pyrophosphatase LpxH